MTTGEMLIVNQMASRTNQSSLRAAAFTAGIGLLVMAIAAPFAELYVFPKLIVSENATETVNNIIANQALFTYGLFGYLIAFLCDVLVAWALYVLLKPVDEHLSLLTAWFRLIYTVIALVALLNLVTVIRVLDIFDPSAMSQLDSLQTQVMFSLNAFRSHWYFGLLFFGIHLGLLGYLVLRSKYVPGILGILLIIAGLGYMLTTLKPFLFPELKLDFAEFTFYGELIFMLWLLVKGPRLQEPKMASDFANQLNK